MEYTVYAFDTSGVPVEIVVIGIEKISSIIGSIEMSAVATLFGLSESKLNRPNSGEIGLLLGVRYAGFHPVRCDSRDHLLLLQNRFGTTIEGTHPSVKETTQITSKCMQLRQATVMFVNSMDDPNSEKFHSVEGLGVSCIPKCGACRCGKCHPGGKDMSLKEEREYELIRNNVQFNPERSRWMTSYPWIINPNKLVKNRSIAFKILKSTERRLLKIRNMLLCIHVKFRTWLIEMLLGRLRSRNWIIIAEQSTTLCIMEYSSQTQCQLHFELYSIQVPPLAICQ